MSRTGTDALATTDEYLVTAEDVDAAGHMTNRRYSELAEHAAVNALASGRRATGGDCASIHRTVARQYSEQFEGSVISVKLGLIDLTTTTAVVHVELRNREVNELASAHRIELAFTAPIDIAATASSLVLLGSDPPTSRTRRLSHGLLPLWTAEQLLAAKLEVWSDRHVEPDECNIEGIYRMGPADLAWGPCGSDRLPTQWQFRTSDGRRYALTVVEYRRTVASRPTVGAHLVTVAANVAVEGKLRIRREWTIEPETNVVHAAGEFVDLLVDLSQRRAVEIPRSIRNALSRYFRPELGQSERLPDPPPTTSTTGAN